MVSIKKTTKIRKVGKILGVDIDSTRKDILLNSVASFLKNKKQFFIVTPNPEIVFASYSDTDLKDSLNSADISIPDGTGLLFAAKILGVNLKSRIQGRLFMEDLFGLSNNHKLKVYLVTGSQSVINATLARLKTEYPSIQARGSVGPKLGQNGKPLTPHEKQIEHSVIEDINTFKPDILFIGFGAPKQEKWFSINRQILKVGGAMVVGGSLDVYSGEKKLPPKILHTIGMEWAWRLYQEPHRFFRIIKAVILFPTLVVFEKTRNLLR